jgi:ribokinase
MYLWDVIVVGGANTDFIVHGHVLPRPGETQVGDSFFTGPGGKGANQAVAAARLGARVALVSAVGADDRGEDLVAQLAAQRVVVSCIQRIPDSITGAAVIHVRSDGQKQISAVAGANRRLRPVDVEGALSRLGPAHVVLLQLELTLDTVRAALARARAGGARTILDPAPAMTLSDEVLSLVDIIKPNSREAKVLTGIDVTDRYSASRAAHALLERGVAVVAIEAGEDGNLLVYPEGEHWMPRIPVRSVDATGAGDAFAGTLATYLARDRSLREAATFANAAAALATTTLGAQTSLARESDLEGLVAETQPTLKRRTG